jgi:twitching motility protein PilI
MARDRNRLLNFQAALGQRLKQAAAQPKRDSRLAVFAANQHFLLDLADVAEVAPVAAVTPVPFTKSWFLGVTNVRGTLYAVSDMAAWILGRRTTSSDAMRVVLLGQRLARLRTAIMVERVVGLRLLDDMVGIPDAELRPWEKSAWRDKDGTAWHEIDLANLVMDSDFLQVVQN